MKTIIALRGPANTGKSQTIKKAMGLTKSQCKDSKDATLMIMINGARIGFESQGDPNSRLKESLDLFTAKNCKVIVCATRTDGETVDAVDALKKKNYEVKWIKQVREKQASKRDKSNSNMARHISREVKKAIRARSH